MLDIMSKFGEEKITDCLQVNIDKMDPDSEDDLKVTYSDTNSDKEGNEMPKEAYLTVPDDYFNKERLDYIFILDEDENDPTHLDEQYSNLI